MKKKGFTLIELLAVIVILAVIALIAVPIILNVIDKSKVGAIKSSAYGILSAADVYVATNLKAGINGTIEFTCTKNKCVAGNETINYKGKIDSGKLLINEKGKTVVCVDDGTYYAYKLEKDKEVTAGEGTCGSYEANNGKFEIISSIASLKANYEAQIAQLKTQVQVKYDEGFNDGKTSSTASFYTMNNGFTLVSGPDWTKNGKDYSGSYYSGVPPMTIELDNANTLKGFIIASNRNPNQGSNGIRTLKIEGSNDSGFTTDVKSQTIDTTTELGGGSGWLIYNMDSTWNTSYKYYRFTIVSMTGPGFNGFYPIY